MNKFKIEIKSPIKNIDFSIPEVNYISIVPGCEGEIVIGSYREDFFIIPSEKWTLEKIMKQWEDGLKRIKTHDSSCLVYSVSSDEEEETIRFWALFKVGSIVFIQDQSVCKDVKKIKKLFENSLDTFPFYSLIMPRIENKEGKGVDEDGDLLWEKSININAV